MKAALLDRSIDHDEGLTAVRLSMERRVSGTVTSTLIKSTKREVQAGTFLYRAEKPETRPSHAERTLSQKIESDGSGSAAQGFRLALVTDFSCYSLE